MKKYRIRVGLDVDDILYDCNAYAIELLNEREGILPPLTVYDVKSWGNSNTATDGRLRYFSDPEFVASQPLLKGAKEFVQELSRIADVFFVTAVPPECMSARALRLRTDFPSVPAENILIGTRKDMVNLDILLDDGAHNIKRSPATYPVLFRKPWNTMLSGLLAVNSYDDFLHLVHIIRNAFVEEKPDLTRGGVICLVGPTGSKKNLIAKTLVKEYGIKKPTTATTRPPRADEDVGCYRFLSDSEFIAEAEAGRFLETTVYGGYHFGTEANEIDGIVSVGSLAVIPIDVCGALTLKNRYRSKALLVFLRRKRFDVICDIVSRDMPPENMTGRILSLDDEYRNEELCDLTVNANEDVSEAAKVIWERVNEEN